MVCCGSRQRKWVGLGVLTALLLCLPGFLQAQQPAKPDAPQSGASPTATPDPAQKPAQSPAQSQNPAQAQQPGSGAQVRTGASLAGEDAIDLETRLLALLGDHQFLEIEKLLESPDGDPTNPDKPKIPPQKAQMLRGILENRENRPEESIRTLEPLLETVTASGNVYDEKLLRETLASDYLREGDLTKAASAYRALEMRLGGKLSPEEREDLELPLKLLPLAVGNPKMTVEPGAAFDLPYDRDALGLTDVPVFVDGQSHDWMMDPTLPFNLVCRSTAKAVGLKISDQFATVHTITGKPIQVHATVIPRFTLGTVTYRNMTAFVYDDADYAFPRSGYQVRGVLGYPAVSALGSITVTADAKIEVQPGAEGEKLSKGARFFLDGDQVVAALGKPGAERMFLIDAGGQQTYLSSRYYVEHADDFAEQKAQLLALPGTQKQPPAPAYVADTVTLLVGEAPMTLHYVQVLTQPLGQAAVDDSYGTLGVDALDELKSYTFDYRTMRFGIRSEVSPAKEIADPFPKVQ